MSKSEVKKRAVKQAQKPEKVPRERKPLSRRAKLILLISAVVLVAAVLTVGLMLRSRAMRRARTTIVGFYDITATQQEAVQAVFERTFSALPEVQAAPAEDMPILQFITLTDDEAADPKLTKKIDVFITQTGALTTSLMTDAAAESAEIADRFPRTTKSSPYFSLDGQFVVMPLFLDHFESAYYTILRDELSAALPGSLTGFAEYADRARESVTYPIVASGADDTVLFAMVSVLAESVAGAEGYQQLVNELSFIAQKGYSFDRALEIPLKGDAPEGLTFGDILQVFTNWRNEGIILGNWYETSEKTMSVFMEDYHTGIVGMMLSQHRRMPYPAIKYYDTAQFPADTSVNRALIAPSVAYMHFNETIATGAFADALSSADYQEYLSNATQLAPTTLRGQSFDRQADDVRYFAATNAGGPVPELGRAVFVSAERRAAFGVWLRGQLSH